MAELGNPPAQPSPRSNAAQASKLPAFVEELGKASRYSAVLSAFGLTLLVGSLAVAAWRLERADSKAREVEAQVAERRVLLAEMETELDKQQASLDSVRREVEDKTRELESKSRQLSKKDTQLDRVQNLVEKSNDITLREQVQRVAPLQPRVARPSAAPSAPLERVSRVDLSVVPTDRVAGDRPLYDIRFSVNVPKERIGEILKAEYFFDHPTFVPKTKVSFDESSGFSVRYFGWGCLDRVKVTLVDKEGRRHELPPVDMCAADAWAHRNARKH